METDISKHIGDRIRTYRKLRKMSINDLSIAIDKSKSIVSKYEAGSVSINLDTLFLIADILCVSPAQLLDYSSSCDSEFQARKKENAYLYLYNNNIKKVVISVIEMCWDVTSTKGTATMFFDISDYEVPNKCTHIYFGEVERKGSFLYFSLNNQGLDMEAEKTFIILSRPLRKNVPLNGLLMFLSPFPIMPISLRVAMSYTIIKDIDSLMEMLLLSKKDYQQMRRSNFFSAYNGFF